MQLTDGENLSPNMACVARDGRVFYFDGPALRSVKVDTLEDRELYRVPQGYKPALPTCTADGRYVMVRGYKHGAGQVALSPPAGLIQPEELPQAAAARELLEETGLVVTDIRLVLVQDCIRPPEFYRDAHFLLLNYTCRCAGEPHVRLNDEAQAHRWLTIEAALAEDLNQPTRALLEAVRARGEPHA